MAALRLITNSEMKTRRRCQREHHYSYDLGYRTLEDAEALLFGTWWHRAMENWWMGVELEACIADACQLTDSPFERAKLRVLLRGYDARWGYDTPFSDVVAVEREFRAPLVNPETNAPSRTFELGGKLDVLLKRRFVEHKTTSEEIGFGSVYWRVLTLDSQVSTYYAGAKSLGNPVDGCIYDVVRKPALRPSSTVPMIDDNGQKIVFGEDGKRVMTKDGKKWRETADTEKGYRLWTREETPEEFEARLLEEVVANPDKYFQRGEVVRLEAEEYEAALDAWQLAKSMQADALADRHPRNADACKRFGRMCPFFEVCTGTLSLDDRSRFQRVENVHQELSQVVG